MNTPTMDPPLNARQTSRAEGCARPGPPVWLAWAITLGETLMLAVGGLALIVFWMMLPVWLRFGAAGLLAGLAAGVLARLARFHWRRTGREQPAWAAGCPRQVVPGPFPERPLADRG